MLSWFEIFELAGSFLLVLAATYYVAEPFLEAPEGREVLSEGSRPEVPLSPDGTP